MKRALATILLLLSTLTFSVESTLAQYNEDYFYWVSRRKMMDSDFHGAISVLNMLLNFNERAHEGYFLRGIAKYNLDDLIGADADFTTALDKNPVFTMAYTYRAITRSRLGNYNDALEDFEKAIELRPDIASPYYSRGVTRLLNGQYHSAIEDFDIFINQEKRVADAYVNRGLCYLSLRDTTEAYNNFTSAIETNRRDPNGYNRRGTLYMQQKEYAQAEEDFNLAIKNDSTYIPALFNRALVYNDTQRPMLALSDLDRVIELDSTSSLSYFNRAIMRSQVGDYNRALEDYNIVAKYSPSNVLVFFYRANLLTRLGDIERAEDDYTRAIELYPDFANAYIYRSELRYLLKDSKGAKRDREIANRKIEEHRSKLQDSTYSIYSDTTYSFNKLLAFDCKLSGSDFNKITSTGEADGELTLIPLFKFSLLHRAETTPSHYTTQLDNFIEKLTQRDSIDVKLTHRPTDISIDSLGTIERRIVADRSSQSWEEIFTLSIIQLHLKQYTKAMQCIDFAINNIDSQNPFFYLNRATTRAEMIDFISSLDNSIQKITIDTDPANRLKNSRSQRVYNYDEAISDLNRAIDLYPTFSQAHYNLGNLLAMSGKYPEAYEAYSRAIEHQPSFAEAYYNRGVVQIMMEDRRKGVLDISKAGELGVTKAYEILKEYGKYR